MQVAKQSADVLGGIQLAANLDKESGSGGVAVWQRLQAVEKAPDLR
jgi:hypothetical protein